MKNRVFKIITVIFKIVVAVFLVVTLNRIFIPKYINENRDGRITGEYYSFAPCADVVFAGSSTVYSDVCPDVLWDEEGISSYVRANASQPVWISYYMVEDAVKCHKPELVCLDMTFAKYDDDFVEEPSTRKSLDGMRLSPSKINCALASMGEDEKLIEYIVPLFRFHTRWKELTWDDIKYAWYFGKVTDNGFIDDTNVNGIEDTELVYSTDDRRLSPKNIEYIEKTIDLCLDNDIRIMLMKTPAHSTNWTDSLDEDIQEIADRYGIEYINFDKYNDDIGLDYSTDTPDDGAHLNTSGAVKFSKYLAHILREDYSPSDRRTDKKYVKRWEKIENR